LVPGESHPFGKSPGWWDLRDLGDDVDDVPAARTALLRALPPIPVTGNVLDIGAGTGTLIALHDIAVPTAPDDLPGRARHAGEHRSLLRRILASLVPGGHLIYADAMRPRFRVVEHIDQLVAAGFVEVDCAYVRGRMLVAGGQRSIAPVAAVNQRPAP